MDDRQFDDISRRVGALNLLRLPRRGVVSLLGSAALGMAAGLGGAGLELADAKKKDKNKDKCKGKNKNKKKCKDKDKKGKCKTSAQFSFTWGSAGAGEGQFNLPTGVATDPSNEDVYVTDNGNQRIQVFNNGGQFIRTWGSQGNGDNQFQTPIGIGITRSSGDTRVFVTDPGQTNDEKKFRRYSQSGNFESDLGRGDMRNPRDVAVDEDDRLWVVNAESSGSVFFFDSNGSFRTVFNPSGNGALQNPAGIGVYTDDGDTFVIIADTGNNRVVKFRHDNDNSDGLEFIDATGQAGSGSDRFNQPLGVAADTCGNFFVADRLNNRIQRLDKDLKFKNPLESGFNRPTDAALSLNGGSLYVADSENSRIQKFNLS